MTKKRNNEIAKEKLEEDLAAIRYYEKYERESTMPAAENEIESLFLNKSTNVFADYEKRKKTAVDFDRVVNIIKAKKR